MKYEIVVTETMLQLESEVNIMIGLGWIPQGGIASDPMGVSQAMIKKEVK